MSFILIQSTDTVDVVSINDPAVSRPKLKEAKRLASEELEAADKEGRKPDISVTSVYDLPMVVANDADRAAGAEVITIRPLTGLEMVRARALAAGTATYESEEYLRFVVNTGVVAVGGEKIEDVAGKLSPDGLTALWIMLMRVSDGPLANQD